MAGLRQAADAALPPGASADNVTTPPAGTRFGAEMADLLRRNFLFRTVLGRAGQQLVTDAQGLIPTLPTPPCEFAVIAGGLGNGRGWNPLIPGDDKEFIPIPQGRPKTVSYP